MNRCLFLSNVLVSLVVLIPATLRAQSGDYEIAGDWEGYNSAGELIRFTASANLDGSYQSHTQIVMPDGEESIHSDGFWITHTGEHTSVATATSSGDQVNFIWYGPDGFRVTWAENIVGIYARVTNPETAGFPGSGGLNEIGAGATYQYSDTALVTINQLAGTWTGQTDFGLGTLTVTIVGASAGHIAIDLVSEDMPSSDSVALQVVGVENGTVTVELSETQGGYPFTMHLNTPGTELLLSIPDMNPMYFTRVEE